MSSTKYSAFMPAMVGDAGPTLAPSVPWQPAQVSASIRALAPETSSGAFSSAAETTNAAPRATTPASRARFLGV